MEVLRRGDREGSDRADGLVLGDIPIIQHWRAFELKTMAYGVTTIYSPVLKLPANRVIFDMF